MNPRDGSFVNELELEVKVEEVKVEVEVKVELEVKVEVEVKHQWKKPELSSGTKMKVILSNG